MLTAADKRHFLLRKLHSLTGILPVGGYLLVHLFVENSAIRFRGVAGWNEVAEFLGNVPLLQVVEVILLASILFHGIYGLVIVKDARMNLTRYPRARNWMFFVQRITGGIAFLFIGYHFATTRLQYYLGSFGFQPAITVNASWMHHNIFGNPAITAIYVVGVVASVFHLTNGIWNMLISWGITVGPTAQKVSAWVCTSAGIAMSAFGVWVIYGFQNVA
jgi:succinate dehydrogenase / fumarate reductase cytochrome b subunit